MKTLNTARCILEPLTRAHAPEMFQVLSDPALYEFENAPPESETWLRNRYERLEARGPADKSEIWLNWVIRLRCGALAGYVQATVLPDRSALIAYELNSRYWRQGIGSLAVSTVLDELHANHAIPSSTVRRVSC
ncbi:GNAT family N-acetyltransferase [Uliginosibacterium paludis]|uniref:GNAT family N-acetyltransferase n=1 Tax=Uliginosibacterium paludis TaxID=1615952 RepID=A0ABV2CUD3_9RHOO